MHLCMMIGIALFALIICNTHKHLYVGQCYRDDKHISQNEIPLGKFSDILRVVCVAGTPENILTVNLTTLQSSNLRDGDAFVLQ